MTDNWTPESEITADLSQTDLTLSAPAIAKFWADALTHDRQAMRDRWAQYRGLVPGVLAGAIITDIEHAKAAP